MVTDDPWYSSRRISANPPDTVALQPRFSVASSVEVGRWSVVLHTPQCISSPMVRKLMTEYYFVCGMRG